MAGLVIWVATIVVALGWFIFVVNAPRAKGGSDEIS